MPTPIRDFIAGRIGGRRTIDSVVTHRTFDDVVLPPRTRAALDEALSLVKSHALIFNQWGLGERHTSDRKLVSPIGSRDANGSP